MVAMGPSSLLIRRKPTELDVKGVFGGVLGASRLSGSVVEAKAQEHQDQEVPDQDSHDRGRNNLFISIKLKLFRHEVKDEKIRARVVKIYKDEISVMEDRDRRLPREDTYKISGLV